AIGSSCTYLDVTKKRGPPKGYIEAIESRLRRMEHLLGDLVHTDPKAAKYVLDALRASEEHGVSETMANPHAKVIGEITVKELESEANLALDQQSPDVQMKDNIMDRPSFKKLRRTSVPPALHASPSAMTTSATTNSTATPSSNIDDSGRPDMLPPPLGQARSRSMSIAAMDRKGKMIDDAEDAEDIDRAEHLTRLEKGVGHLTLDPTGSLRYLGDSSGWYIINRSLVSSESSPRLTKGVHGAFRWPPITTLPNAREGESGSSKQPANAAPAGTESSAASAAAAPAAATSGSGAQPNKENVMACVVPVPRNMPPCGKPPMPDREEADHLIHLYFQYVHPVFPIIYKSYFLTRYHCKDTQPSHALLSAIYAAASTYKAREAKCEKDLARVRIQMAVHFQRAKTFLDEQYTLNTTASILTLLLMSVYEQGTMSTRSWLYSGMAIRKAYDLGLHRDVGISKHNPNAIVSRTETEVRLRAWWGCYIMDIMVSATLGRPTTIHDFTFDAPFPTDYGDDDNELLVRSSLADNSPASAEAPSSSAHRTSSHQQSSSSKIIPPAMAERMRDYVSLEIGDSDSDSEISDMENEETSHRKPRKCKPLGVYYLELLHIFGHVLSEMYACKPNRSFVAKYCLHDLHSRIERLITLDHELRRWKMSLPPDLQYPIEDILAAKPARCVYIALIHLVYYTAMILLHRPFISRLDDPQHTEHEDGTEHRAKHNSESPMPSHAICTLSAQMISLIGLAIIQDSRIFIMPFLTFMMFTAGTMHLNNVIVAADSWIARRFLKRTLDVMSRLGAHWQVSYKCYTMLNTLVRANRIGLDSVIDDSEAGVHLIRERCREIWRLAHQVYENRSLYRERASTTQLNTARSETTSRRSESVDQSPAMDRGTFQKRASSHANEPLATFAQNMKTSESAPDLYVQQQVNQAKHRLKRAMERQGLRNIDVHRSEEVAKMSSKLYKDSPDIATYLAARMHVDRTGNPMVPASPFTSVNLSDPEPPATTPSAGIRASQTATTMSVLSQPMASEPVRLGAANAAMTLGQFVPSLEFFANADFPLGIGGPNGQASSVLPQAMGVRNNSGPYSLLSFSDQVGPSPGLGVSMSSTSTFTSTVVNAAAAAAPPPMRSSAMQPNVMPMDSYGSGQVGPANIQAMQASMGIQGSSVPNMTGLPIQGGFGYNNPNNVKSAHTGMQVDNKLIDDEVIRNLPFTGPVSCDLSLGNENDLMSALWPNNNVRMEEPQQQQQQQPAVMGSSSGRQQGDVMGIPMPVGINSNGYIEMPWKDYVNQVIGSMLNPSTPGSGQSSDLAPDANAMQM
ncbi:hypothetical protein FBU59_001000, partial [Linderina macrospora]